MRTEARALLPVVALVLGAAAAAAAAAAGNLSGRAVDEASAVVAYLYNFGKFVEWPATAFESSSSPLRFCFYGNDSWGSIASSLRSKRARGRPIDVVTVKRGGPLDHCHLLYIDDSERLYIRPLLGLVRAMPILTVSEIDGFAAAGGIIGLVHAESRLKFEINTNAADQSKLHVSSQLLKLAVDLIR